jgi:hypothetical protein
VPCYSWSSTLTAFSCFTRYRLAKTAIAGPGQYLMEGQANGLAWRLDGGHESPLKLVFRGEAHMTEHGPSEMERKAATSLRQELRLGVKVNSKRPTG